MGEGRVGGESDNISSLIVKFVQKWQKNLVTIHRGDDKRADS